MDTISYKGYQIQASPYQLADSGRFKITICITVERGADTILRKFSAGNTFETRQEAIEHCFTFGKQIIDGQVLECTVSDL